jgi:AcrR family transcriptional regulator
MAVRKAEKGIESVEPVDGAGLTRGSRRRGRTRKKLLEAAYQVMSRRGVDAATIQEITEQADVGFGTFYNYFSSKEELAAKVLDCMINDLGRRNDLATMPYKRTDPARVQVFSARMTIREAVNERMWHWWAQKPDLLVDRMRECLMPFGVRDIYLAIRAGAFRLEESDAESVWGQTVWLMVGGMRDIIIGHESSSHERLIADLLMRVVGVPPAIAHELTTAPLPNYPPSNIDFSYDITIDPALKKYSAG